VETPIGILKTNRIGVQLDLIKSGSVDTGPIVRYAFGRDDSVSDPLVAALPAVDPSVEIGWFIGSGFPLRLTGIDSDAIVIGDVSVVTDIADGHGGTVYNGSVGLVMQLTEKFRIVPSLSFTYADDNYTKAFYGVGSTSETTDSLPVYRPSGGLESNQAALVAIRTIDEHWAMTGVFAYTFLQGDAAESPIVLRGSDEQLFTGVTLSYKF